MINGKILHKIIFVVFLFVIVLSFSATVVYASDTSSDNYFNIEFKGDQGSSGDPPILDPVENDTSIILPSNTFIKENYKFTGWSDGDTIYLENDTYIINSDVTFIAQWEEIEKETDILDTTQVDKVIDGYKHYDDVILSEDLHIIDLDMLKASGKLPGSLTLLSTDTELEPLDITWSGEFDGSTIGNYILTGSWDINNIPEGYIVDEEFEDITINIKVEEAQTIETQIMGSSIIENFDIENIYTVYGTEHDDEIYIENLENDIIKITIIGNDSTKTYQLSNKNKIIINAGDGNDTIYFNLTEKSKKLTEIVVLGGIGEDIITTELTTEDTIDLTGVDVLLKAEKVLFDIESLGEGKLSILVNSLDVQAAPTQKALFNSTQNIKVIFRNVHIKATENFIVDATSYISNGQEVEDQSGDGTIYEIIVDEVSETSNQVVETIVEGTSDTLQTVVNVAPISVEVEVDTAKIEANDISIKAINDIEMKTGSDIIPATITIADLVSKINIKGASSLISENNISLISQGSIIANGDASTRLSLPLSLGVMVLSSDIEASVMDTSVLDAGKDIYITAENIVDTSNLACGNDETSNGAYVSVTIANQKTEASIKGEASVKNGGNLEISSKEISKTQTIAETSGDDSVDEGETEEEGYTFKDLLNILASFKNPAKTDEENNQENLIRDEELNTIENNFNDSANGLDENSSDGTDGEGTVGDEEETNGDAAAIQIVGSVGLIVADSNNSAYIDTTGLINISGLLSISAEAVSHHIVIADASAVKASGDEEEETGSTKFGLGVGVAIGNVSYKNLAYIGSNGNIKAGGLTIQALTGNMDKEGEEEPLNNELIVNAKAGYNKSNFGIGGAIAINIFDGSTKAYINDGTIITIIDAASIPSNIKVQAVDYSSTETIADASSQDEAGSSTGIGSGIAISIFDNEVIAYIGEVTINGIVNDLQVSSSSKGSNVTIAIAGADGGICIVPVLALNMVNNNVEASIKEFAQAILVSGDIVIEASGIRNSQTEGNAEAGGENVAIGAAVAIGLIDTSELAKLERSIGSKNSPAQSIMVNAIGIGYHEVSSYAGKNGGQEDVEDEDEGTEEEEKKGSITDIINKAMGSINSNRSSEGLSEKDTTDTASEKKAETTEGTLTFAASLALNIYNSNTIAEIGSLSIPVIIYTGDLNVTTSTNKDAIANANASATADDGSDTNSKVGIGAAAGILDVKSINKAIIGSGSIIHANGNIIVKSDMAAVEEAVIDEDGNEVLDEDGNIVTEENEENNFGVAAQSGAGGSNLSLAGSVALAMIDTSYEAIIDGELYADGNIDVDVFTVQVVEVAATAESVKTIAGKSNKKRKSTSTGGGVGIGASFAMTTIKTNARAKTTTGSILNAGGHIRIGANLENNVTTIAEAGEESQEEEEDGETQPNKTALDAAVAITLVDINVEAIIGASNDGTTNITTDGNLIIDADISSIIQTETKSNTNATNASIGATVAISIVNDNVIAQLLGNASVGGNALITADAITEDIVIAYASSNGVEVDEYSDKDASSAKSLEILNDSDIKAATQTKNVDQGNGEVSDGSNISIAAAIAINKIEHNVTASIEGIILNANSIEVLSNNTNFIKTYATGETVSNDKAISVAVGVAINNSENKASLGTAKDIKGDIIVQANTQNNVGEEHKGEISVQAIAGSKSGTDGNFGAAGAVAVFVSNSKTKAYILDNVEIISTLGKLTIKANEKARLAIRAWGTTSGATGVGAAFAILYSNSEISAYIGEGSTIEVKALSIQAIKESVKSDYQSILDELKEIFPNVDDFQDDVSQEGSEESKNVVVNAETIQSIVDGLNDMDLELYLNYITSSNYYVEAVGGALGSQDATFAGAGSFALLFFKNITNAYIGDNVSIRIIDGGSSLEDNSIEVMASSEINAMAIGGSTASGGDNSVGLTAVVFDNNDNILSYIGKNVEINNFNKDILISANATQNFWTIAVGASKADKAGVAGIVNVILSDNNVKAYIDENNSHKTIQGSGNLTISAENTTDIRSILGGVSYGTKAGVGVSCLFLTLSNNTEAFIGEGVDLNINSNVLTIAGKTKESILTVSVNGAASQGSSISVGPTIKVIDSKVKAYIGANTKITAGEISIIADSVTDIIGIAGAISGSFGGKVSIGAVNDTNTLDKTVHAYIGNGTIIHCLGDIDIQATSNENIISFVVGVAISSGTSGEGSVAVDLISNDVQAYIDEDVKVNFDSVRAGNINILARDHVDLLIIAGGLSGSTGSAAMGISSSIVTFEGTTKAYIGARARINASKISIKADALENIMVIVASGGLSSNVTINGSVNVVVFNQSTEAVIKEGAVLESLGNIMVIAIDKTDIKNRVGTIGGAGAVAIGVSSDTLSFTKKVKAIISNGTLIISEKNIIVYANSVEDIDVIVAGASGSGTTAINGSSSVIVFNNEVISSIGTENGTSENYATADSDGSIAIMAEDSQNISIIAGSANGSGVVAVAAGSSVITSTNKVNAEAGRYADLNAYGQYAVLTYTGEKGKEKANYYGLLIGAYNISDIEQQIYCVSGSGAAAVAGAVATTITKAETTAKIQSYASINQGDRQTHQQQTVRVVAVSESSVDVIDGGAAASAYAGIGAGVVVVIQDKTTIAEISNYAKIYAKEDIVLIARTENTIDIVVASLGGAIVGVSGSVAVISITDHTTAKIGASTEITAGDDINISSYANQGIDVKAGSIAGGAVAVGGASITVTLTADTIAKINDSAILNAGKNIKLVANSYENIEMTAAGAAGSAVVSASGSVVVLVLNITTQALIGNSVEVAAGEELKIHGKDHSNINGLAGGAAIGGAAGAGGSVVTILYRNTVTAGVGNNGNIEAGYINIIAETDRGIETGAAMLSGGLGAVSGSVIVISIGKATDDEDTSTALQGEESNTIEQSQADITGALNNSKIHMDSSNENNQEYINQVNEQIADVSIPLAGFFTGDNIADKTTAFMGNGGTTVATSGDITIEAKETTNITADAGSVSGGGVAVGGAVIIATLNGTTESRADGDINSAGDLSIIAENNIEILRMQTIAGTGGAISLGAAVTKANISGNVWAYMANGTSITNANNIDIKADLNIEVNSNAYGAAVGVEAAGVSVSEVNITADVKAYAEGVKITKVGTFTILANSRADISTNVIAASAGGVTGSGAVVNIIHNGSVKAYISGQTSICSSGDVSVTAMGYENLNAQGQGLSGAVVASIGAVFVTITNSLEVDAYIEDSNITTSGDIAIRAVNEDILTAIAKGTSGGLLAAGAAQTAKVTEEVKVNAKVNGEGHDLKSTNGSIIIISHNDSTINVRATGCAIAGFVAGGWTEADAIINNTSKITIGSKITLDAFEDITVLASNYIWKDTYGSASAAALGTVNDVSTTSKITITTAIDIESSAVLTALGDINIQAITDKYYKAYATAIAGGILAKGVATAEQEIIDGVTINISDNVGILAGGYIYISTDTAIIDNTTPVSQAIGGAGGLAAGTSVLSRLDTIANSKIITGENVEIISALDDVASDDVTLIATGNLRSLIKSKIKFTIDGVSIIATQSLATSEINGIVTLGSGTKIKGVNVTIHGEVNEIYVYADAYSETGSIINTQSKPSAIISTDAKGKVKGTLVTLDASNNLGIYGTVNDITLITKSYGYTAGATGSVISTCKNDANIYGTIEILNDGSSLRGRNIEIIATSPRESQVAYTKEATYKADTVVEYVTKTIEKVVEVVEEVTEKVTKWMPWPVNKIVKWVVKTVVKTVTVLVDIIVEVVLNSEVEAVVDGSYLSENNVTLNGHIYYGSNVPVNIVIDENGDISSAEGIDYVKDDTNKVITINSFESASAGSLMISSYFGRVSGNVTVHSNSILSQLAIINNSTYDLVIKDLSITTNDNPNASNYQISCSVNDLVMHDVTDVTEAPLISIISINNTDVTFAGIITGYSVILDISMYGGNIYMTSDGQLEVNKINITGAKNVGTNTDRFKISSYITTNDEVDINPEVNILATGDVYVTIGLRKYINNTDGTIDIESIQMLDGAKIINIKAGNTLSVTFSEAALIVAESTSDNITSTYTYIEIVYEQEDINEDIESYTEYTKILIEEQLYVRYEYDEENNTYIEKYYLDEEYTREYEVADGYHIVSETKDEVLTYYLISDLPESGYRYIEDGSEYTYDTDVYQGIGYDKDKGKYYLIKETKKEVTAEFDETITIEGVRIDVVYINGIYYIQDASGKDIIITGYGTENTNTNLYFQGDIIGEDSINVITYNGTNVIITGRISTEGTSIGLNIDGNLSLNGNGSIIGNTASTMVNIKAGEITTDKGIADRVDISGKELVFILNNGGMGSTTNPISINTGIGGLSITANGAYPITILNFTDPLYIKKIETLGEVVIKSKYKVINAREDSGANIIAGKLTLNISEDGHGIGASNDYIVINIGTGGIYVSAKDDIYLKQIERAAYIGNINSEKGSIDLISSGDIIITNITANTYADITSVNGNIIGAINEEVITALTITLTAGGGIGSSTQSIVLGLGDGELSISANNDIFIEDNEGNINLINVLSENGNITLIANGSIVNGRTDNGVNLKGNHINLRASNIGTIEQLIPITTINGLLNIESENDVYIISKNSTLQLGKIIVNNGNLLLSSETHIVNGLVEGINIKAANITIKMQGKDLGTKQNSVLVDTEQDGEFFVEANNVYIEEVDSLVLKEAILTGEMVIASGCDIRIELIDAQGNVTIMASNGNISIDTIRSGADIELKADLGGIYNIKNNAGANLYGKDIKLDVFKGIGIEEKYLMLDMIEGGKLTAKAGEEIYIREINGDVNISSIETEKDVYIISNGSILNGNIARINIIASNITLQSELGSIGLQDSYLTIKTLNKGHLNAKTIDKGIYIHGLDEDIILDLIDAGSGSVEIKAEGSILNGLNDEEGINIIASTLYLEANGSIGQRIENIILPIYTELLDNTRIDIRAKGNVYLEEKTGNLGLGIIIVKGEEFYLTLPGDIYTTLTQEDMQKGIANINANTVIITAINGQIGEDKNDNPTYLDEDYEGWITTSSIETEKIYEINIYAQGDIYIREIRDSLIIGQIKSQTGDINLSAFMDLKSYNEKDAERVNVVGKDIYLETTKGMISTSIKAGEDVVINSCGSIQNMEGEGYDSIQISGNNITIISREGSVGEEDSYIEIDTIETGVLNIIAHKGIYIREISGNFTIGSIISETGDVMLEVVDGRLISTLGEGSLGIIGKNIKIVSLTSSIGSHEGYIRLDSDGSIIIEALEDIYLKEVNGDMVLRQVNTLGNIYLLADNNILVAEELDGSIITGENITLTALKGSIGTLDKFITIDTINSGSINAIAKEDIYIRETEGDLRVDKVKAGNKIVLEGSGKLLNVDSTEDDYANIAAHEIILQGFTDIGEQEKYLIIDVEGEGSVFAKALGSIYLTEYQGDLRIKEIIAAKDVYLEASGDVLNINESQDAAIIKGKTIRINAVGSIGQSDKFINIITLDNGYIGLLSGGSIYVSEIAGDLRIDYIEAKDIVNLKAVKSIIGIEDNLHIKANQLILKAEDSIGTIENPLNIRVERIIANAGDNITLATDQGINIEKMNAVNNITLTSDENIIIEEMTTGVNITISAKESINVKEMTAVENITLTSNGIINIEEINAGDYIFIEATNIMGNNIIGDTLEIKALGSIGSLEDPLLTTINSVIINAGKDVYLKNSKDLNIISIEGKTIEVQAESVRGVDGTAITGKDLRLIVNKGIGQSKTNPLITNVNSFTGVTASNSIYLRNTKNITINHIKAPNNVYLFISGSLEGKGITANKLIFEARNVRINSKVNYIEGKSTKDVRITNTGKLIIGSVDNSYQGIQAAGIIDITAKSPIQILENMISGGKLNLNAGHSTTMEDSLIIDSGATVESKTSTINISAGDKIIIKSGSNVSGKIININCGKNNPNNEKTLIDIAGNIITENVYISGGATLKIIAIETMGNIEIHSIDSGSKIDILVNSLGGSINIQGGKGKDNISLDMKNTIGGATREIVIQGNGSQDEYNIKLNDSRNQNTFKIIGSGKANINTTNKDENLEIYRDRITINSGKGLTTIYLDRVDETFLQNLGGNNRFDLYDTPSSMNIKTGNGNDKFYIGKLVKTSATNGTKTTEGWLTRGTSYNLSIETSGGNNLFTIYSTRSPLRIIGGNGNEAFMLKAFIEILSDGRLTRYENGTIYIDGGRGLNQLTIMKSALFDYYDVGEDTVKGSGFDISFNNINDVNVVKFEPAEDSGSAITKEQLIKYSFIQLKETGALYIIIVILSAMIAILIYDKRKKKKVN
jgi:hypothetical protein